MVVVIPTNKSVEAFEGLHLYHGDIFELLDAGADDPDPKGLPWTSHHLDLKKENISDDYFGINPNGLVPTLVDNGVVHIESNVIDYLDETYDGPSLRPKDPDREAEMLEWLKLAGSIHVPAVKPYVYATRIAKKVKRPKKKKPNITRCSRTMSSRPFAKHAQGKAFSDDDITKAIGILKECFSAYDTTLASRTWVMGEEFSLADISWIPLHHVLIGCDFPFDQYPNIQRWAAAFHAKPSFQEGVLKWCPDFSKVRASHACLRPDQKVTGDWHKNELIGMQHFIGGEWTDAENAAVFDDFNPWMTASTGEPPREPVRICRAPLRLRGAPFRRTKPASRSNGNAGSFALPS